MEKPRAVQLRQVRHPSDRARTDGARTCDLEDALGIHAFVFFRSALLREPIELAIPLACVHPAFPQNGCTRNCAASPRHAWRQQSPNALRSTWAPRSIRKPRAEGKREVQADYHVGIPGGFVDQVLDQFATAPPRLQTLEASVANLGQPDLALCPSPALRTNRRR